MMFTNCKFRPTVWLVAACAASAFLPLAAGAQTPQIAPLPEGSVAIHYYRPAGDYDGWGVHVWESFEKIQDMKVVGPREKSDAPLSGVTWMAPMKPTGKDGFGVYWQVKANEFRNQKINYIVHKGDTKDQCGKDMYWFLPQGKEVFVNQGDCNLYFSADEAIKARK